MGKITLKSDKSRRPSEESCLEARDRGAWALAVFVSVSILIAPALWNGFALLQWDTGGYLARTYESILVPSRPIAYGLILRAGVPFGFWPVLLLQSALTVWVLALVLRAHGFGNRPWLLTGIVAALSVVTTLPWLTSILLTDIFCGLAVLSLYLLLLRPHTLTRGERYALIALIAVSAATHSATSVLLLACLVAAFALWLVYREAIAAKSLRDGAVALIMGALIVLATNVAVARQLAWTPGGPSLLFGRMLQDGIVQKYLNEHCPDRTLKLCAYKNELPHDADEWFWGNELFDKLGRFAGLDSEMEKIAGRSLVAYPGLQAMAALTATGRQLVAVHSGEGVLNTLWHTYGIVERYTPTLLPAVKAARQQQRGISFDALNRLHYPIAILSIALLPILVGMAWRGRLPSELGELAAFCTVALLANAVICGALSNPHDRYGARLVWLTSFVVTIAALRCVAAWRRAEAMTAKPARLN